MFFMVSVSLKVKQSPAGIHKDHSPVSKSYYYNWIKHKIL